MKILKYFALIVFAIILSLSLNAQDPPDPPGEHGSGDDQPAGGDAPLGSAQMLLLGFAAVYGGKKIFDLRNMKALDIKKPDDPH